MRSEVSSQFKKLWVPLDFCNGGYDAVDTMSRVPRRVAHSVGYRISKGGNQGRMSLKHLKSNSETYVCLLLIFAFFS